MGFVPEIRPEAAVVRVPSQGLRGPCAYRNRALLSSRAEWVFLLDEDAEPEAECLDRLLDEAARHPQASIISPRVMLGGSDVVHYDGARAHFLAEACFDNFHRPRPRARAPDLWPGAAAATALLIRREDAIRWGLFDEGLVFFREDVEFCLRARLLGGLIRHCPQAVVRHRQGARGPLHERRVYYQARNRWRLMLKLYQWRTLALTFPPQATFEALSLCRSAAQGKLGQHAAALAGVALDLPRLLRQRRALQARRRLDDRALLRAAPLTWRPATMALPGAFLFQSLLSLACAAWWRLALEVL